MRLLYLFTLVLFTISSQAQLSIIEDNVNLRTEPQTDAEIVTQLQTGDACTELQQSAFFETVGKRTDYWYQVNSGGKSGWVFGAQTSKRLSDNPQYLTAVYTNAERVGGTLHIYFQSINYIDKGWKGHGTNTWDFGYGDYENKYKYKLYKGGSKDGDLTVKGQQNRTFVIEWKVATVKEPNRGNVRSFEKEVPVILSMKRLKDKPARVPKEPKGEEAPSGRF